jgi:hypothetical protein
MTRWGEAFNHQSGGQIDKLQSTRSPLVDWRSEATTPAVRIQTGDTHYVSTALIASF